MNKILKENIEAVKELCENHHIKHLYAFGSVTDQSFSNESDIDLLYEFDYGNFNINTDPIAQIPFDPFLEFNSLKEASDYFNIDGSCISKCCLGKRKSTKGYEFRYVNDIV